MTEKIGILNVEELKKELRDRRGGGRNPAYDKAINLALQHGASYIIVNTGGQGRGLIWRARKYGLKGSVKKMNDGRFKVILYRPEFIEQ